MTELDRKVLALIWHCRGRLGVGFGQYPLGVRYAIGELLPLCTPGEEALQAALADLDKRLSE